MKKEELQQNIGELKSKIEQWEANDEVCRRNVSQFLGSYKPEKYYDNTREVKVLKWAEIYFELGKLKQQEWRTAELGRITENLNYLLEKDKNKEVLP